MNGMSAAGGGGDPDPIRILLVEDATPDAELEMRALARAGVAAVHHTVETAEAMREEIARFAPDVILSDFTLPQFDGRSALMLARELAPDTPFIFVSGTVGEEAAIRALKDGAADYVLKSNLARLPSAVERAVQEARERVARRKAEKRLARLSRIREVLREINAAIVRMRDRQALFEESCRIAVDVGGFRVAWVGLPDPVTRAIRPVAQRGAAGSNVLASQLSAGADGEAGTVMRTRRATVWNELAGESGAPGRENAIAFGSRSAAALPLLVDGKPVGALTLYSAEPHFFDHEELGLLREVAGNISFALELIAKQERVNYLALYDPLTDLPNRALLHERLQQLVEAQERAHGKLALALFDVEHFQDVNNIFGRHVGDELLRLIGRRLRGAAPDDSGVARPGGDRFALVIADVGDEATVGNLLERCVMELSDTPYAIDEQEVQLSIRAGVALYPTDAESAEALFQSAEAALRQVKQSRGRFLFYSAGQNKRVSERLMLESRLRRALADRRFVLHFQPIVDVVTRSIRGVEALLRWNDPDDGLVPPARFIPVLEETGLIVDVGRWAIEEALAMGRKWRSLGLGAPRIAVNVSPLQLQNDAFISDVAALVDGECRLELEITEGLVMEDVEGTIQKLRALQALGVRVALDDFGTGYSSLSYISKLPINALKIDRSFISGATENSHDTSIVNAIISLAQTLRLSVTAEGVETEEQARLLRLLRCDHMQGYLFSRPVASERIEELLRRAPG